MKASCAKSPVRPAWTRTRPIIDFVERTGKINSDLTVGVDVTAASALARKRGHLLAGREATRVRFHRDTQRGGSLLGWANGRGLKSTSATTATGAILTARPRGVMVIDLFGLDVERSAKPVPGGLSAPPPEP